jgi:hypothetical protein
VDLFDVDMENFGEIEILSFGPYHLSMVQAQQLPSGDIAIHHSSLFREIEHSIAAALQSI